MADEQENIDSPELESPAIEVEQDPTTNDNEVEEAETPETAELVEGADEALEPEVEYAEIERNGKKYQVPKELESEFLMQGDYTRKTQEVAAQRKELEAFEAKVRQQAQFTEEELTERATLVNVNSQLEQYKAVDWNAWEQEDPMAANSHWRQFQTLKEQRAELTANLGQRQEFRTLEAQQDIAKRIEETKKFAQAEIKGWTPAIDEQILGFTQQMGIDKEAIVQAMNPQVYKILHMAWVGSQALNKPANTAPKINPKVEIKPLSTVSAKSSPTGRVNVAEIDNMDEYAAARRKQMARR